MPELQPLHTLLEQASAVRDQALATHRHALAALQALLDQGEQLGAYRREYTERFDQHLRSAGAIELMQCYQGFMTRLDAALAQHADARAKASARVDAAKAALLAAELRVASVRKLVERRVADAALRQAQREQKASDEFAGRSAWQRAAGAGAFGLV